MEDKTNVEREHEKQLMIRTLWLNTRVIAIATGVVCGVVIFIATNWLVIKGGDPVGPHLQLLAQFFWGYRVTFWGSLVGFCYGFVTGFICGGLVGWIYNRLAAGGTDG